MLAVPLIEEELQRCTEATERALLCVEALRQLLPVSDGKLVTYRNTTDTPFLIICNLLVSQC